MRQLLLGRVVGLGEMQKSVRPFLVLQFWNVSPTSMTGRSGGSSPGSGIASGRAGASRRRSAVARRGEPRLAPAVPREVTERACDPKAPGQDMLLLPTPAPTSWTPRPCTWSDWSSCSVSCNFGLRFRHCGSNEESERCGSEVNICKKK
jgi:hypothetical protein